MAPRNPLAQIPPVRSPAAEEIEPTSPRTWIGQSEFACCRRRADVHPIAIGAHTRVSPVSSTSSTGKIVKSHNFNGTISKRKDSVTSRRPTIIQDEADGWEVLRRNKRSVRLKKQKPQDRQLEDDVWCVLYNMGFKELNEDRNFTIRLSDRTPPRQLDLFVKDDQTAFIVECTQSRDSGSRSVKVLIDKIGSIRADVVNAIHVHYGRHPGLKVKFAIATRNIG
jgi:hypothetical protein